MLNINKEELSNAINGMLEVIKDYSKAGIKNKAKKNIDELCLDEIIFSGFIGPLGNENTRGNHPKPPYSEVIPKNIKLGNFTFSISLLITVVCLLFLDINILKLLFSGGILAILSIILIAFPALFTVIYLLYARHNTTFVRTINLKTSNRAIFEGIGLWDCINYITTANFRMLLTSLGDEKNFDAVVNNIIEDAAIKKEFQIKAHDKTSSHNRAVNAKAMQDLVKTVRETSNSKSSFDKDAYSRQIKTEAAQMKMKSAARNYEVAVKTGNKQNAANAERLMNEAKAELLASKSGNTADLNRAKTAAHNLAVGKTISSPEGKHIAAKAEREYNEAMANLLAKSDD